MSVREIIRSLTFHGGEADWEGLFGEQLVQWSARFRLELHGEENPYEGTVVAACDSPEVALEWDRKPPGDERFIGNLERFVRVAFRESVHVGLVIEPLNVDEVESEYLAEEDEIL